MNEPSPRRAEANDMELVTTRASPFADRLRLRSRRFLVYRPTSRGPERGTRCVRSTGERQRKAGSADTRNCFSGDLRLTLVLPTLRGVQRRLLLAAFLWSARTISFRERKETVLDIGTKCLMSHQKNVNIQQFFSAHPRCALAFSGGVDSSYLLYAGLQCGAEIRPYYVKSQFQPDFEYRDALRLCRDLGVEPVVLRFDALCSPAVRANGPDRCYHCKINIMSTIIARASADAFPILLDGTNASDEAGDRPGMRALGELGILSPLRLCGLTKPEIRRLSRKAGLFTWDKPAYACLATRVKTGEEITNERLSAVERGEDWLFSQGFTDFRLRTAGRNALLQFPEGQLARARELLPEIREKLSADFADIEIDPKGRTTAL